MLIVDVTWKDGDSTTFRAHTKQLAATEGPLILELSSGGSAIVNLKQSRYVRMVEEKEDNCAVSANLRLLGGGPQTT